MPKDIVPKEFSKLQEDQQRIAKEIAKLTFEAQRYAGFIDECNSQERETERRILELEKEILQETRKSDRENFELKNFTSRTEKLQESLEAIDLQQLINDFIDKAVAVVDAALARSRINKKEIEEGKNDKNYLNEKRDELEGVPREDFLYAESNGVIEEINNVVRKHNQSAPKLTGEAYKAYSKAYSSITQPIKYNLEVANTLPAKKKASMAKIVKHQANLEQRFKQKEQLQNDLEKLKQSKDRKEFEKELELINQNLDKLRQEQYVIKGQFLQFQKQVDQYQKNEKEIADNMEVVSHLSSPNHNVGYSLEIHQLDVGQGESALIVCKFYGFLSWSVLLDAGEKVNKNSDHIANYVKNIIGKDGKLSAVIISHNDKDHHGRLVKDLKEVKENPITNFIDNATLFITQDGTFNWNIDDDEEQNRDNRLMINENIWDLLDLDPNQHYLFPSMTCVAHGAVVRGKNNTKKDMTGFLSSTAVADDDDDEDDDDKDKKKNKNERSLGFLIDFGDFKFYTAGDLASQIEDNIDIRKVSVFKAGHHGSKYSTSSGLVSNITPRAVVISHGNKIFKGEGHPNQFALTNINEDNNLQIAYLTNPVDREKKDETDKADFIEENSKFVIAGSATLLNSDNPNKNPRGDVVFSVTASQAKQKDVFFASYRQRYKGEKGNIKSKVVVDHFTNVEKFGAPKITEKVLNESKSVAVESSGSIVLDDPKKNKESWVAKMASRSNAALDMAGHYRTEKEKYKTDSGKEKESHSNRLVLKSTANNLKDNQQFLKALNPEGHDKLMQTVDLEIRNKIEIDHKEQGSKLKVKASNIDNNSVSLSWIEKVDGGKAHKHKLKIKSIIAKGDTEKRFVDRISYTDTNKTK